jgi:hypothetical protein
MTHIDDRRDPTATPDRWLVAVARALTMPWLVSPFAWTARGRERAAGRPRVRS